MGAPSHWHRRGDVPPPVVSIKAGTFKAWRPAFGHFGACRHTFSQMASQTGGSGKARRRHKRSHWQRNWYKASSGLHLIPASTFELQPCFLCKPKADSPFPVQLRLSKRPARTSAFHPILDLRQNSSQPQFPHALFQCFTGGILREGKRGEEHLCIDRWIGLPRARQPMLRLCILADDV